MGPRSFLLVALVAGPACDALASTDAESIARIELDDAVLADASSGADDDVIARDDDGPGCDAYCHAYVTRCGGGAFRDLSACIDACAAWEPGTPGARADSLACRSALLDEADGPMSCIAGGPSSPVCREPGSAATCAEASARCV